MKSMGGIWMMMVSWFLVLVVLMKEGAVDAKEFKVGDDFGWQEPNVNYTQIYDQWAERHRFHVGDSLYFEYKKKEDSVLVVEKWEYYHCNTSKPITAFENGKTTVELERPGPYYFISGAPDHCMKGQRVVVDVMSPHPPPPSDVDPPAASHSHISPSPAPTSSVSALMPISISLLLLLSFLALSSLPLSFTFYSSIV